MKNIQISFDENMIREIDRVASSAQTTRSAVIRDAIRHWLKEKEIKDFEKKWIHCLKEHPEDPNEVEKWINAQEWTEK